MLEVLAGQMSVMLFLILIGMFARKREIVTEEGKKTLSNLVINIILPFNIVHAYMIKLPDNFFILFFEVLAVTILNQVIAMLITRFLYNRIERRERSIYQYATICSNAGFMGNALAESIFGELGLLYASIFLIPQRIMMWTAGISFFQQDVDKKEAYKKVLLHPCMIATYLGLVIMIFHISLPVPAGSTTAILAAQYGADEKTAVKCVVLSTALSIITTSLWGMLLMSYL